MSEKKTPQIVFAPGCFDGFDGTQEELDEMLAEIQRLVESGELFERAQPVDFDDGTWTEEEIERLSESFEDFENIKPRKLN